MQVHLIVKPFVFFKSVEGRFFKIFIIGDENEPEAVKAPGIPFVLAGLEQPRDALDKFCGVRLHYVNKQPAADIELIPQCNFSCTGALLILDLPENILGAVTAQLISYEILDTFVAHRLTILKDSP